MRHLTGILFALLAALAAHAQQPPRMTWVRYYEIVPGKEAEFIQLVRTSNAVVDRLVAEKKVVAWGLLVPMSQIPDSWTHAVYVTLQDYASLETLVNAAIADYASLPADQRAKHDAVMRNAIRSTRDEVLHHVVQSEAMPASKPKYVAIRTYSIKPDRHADATALFSEWAKPVFNDVLAKGKFGPWGFSTQEETFRTGGWTHMVWTFMSDLTALDDLDAAFATLGATKLRGFDIRLRDMSDPGEMRGQLLRIVHAVP
ncbi:MAG TPA: hypothetical protein VNA69_19350 [Thermoanaerobaculia bacterium]|nr:hypothetical protein [Thermoanaerobaculia bacterium]